MSYLKVVLTSLFRFGCILVSFILFLGILASYFFTQNLCWIFYTFGIIGWMRHFYCSLTGDYYIERSYNNISHICFASDPNPYRIFWKAPDKLCFGMTTWWEKTLAFVMPVVILLIFIRPVG
jgi:hypothetical protein